MCHLVLLMPVIGLILFWILPFYLALPFYAIVAVASGLIYYSIMKASHRPREIGKENMIGRHAEVIQKINPLGQVVIDGEIWEAESDEILGKGEKVEITALNGLTLRVHKP
jgi:membrane-bound serine protease (ClpP class)